MREIKKEEQSAKRTVSIALGKAEIIRERIHTSKLRSSVREWSSLFSYIQVKVSRKYDWELLYYHPNFAVNKHQFPTRLG